MFLVTLVVVEGDFAHVFDADDYTTMINALDEATVVCEHTWS